MNKNLPITTYGQLATGEKHDTFDCTEFGCLY